MEAYIRGHLGVSWRAGWKQITMCHQGPREEPQYFLDYEVDHDDYLKSALFSEIQILQLLKSENVVKVLDVMESSHNYYIIQEICDNDLEHYIEQHPHISEN